MEGAGERIGDQLALSMSDRKRTTQSRNRERYDLSAAELLGGASLQRCDDPHGSWGSAAELLVCASLKVVPAGYSQRITPRTRAPQAAANPKATTNANPVIRPETVFLLQAWSTATSQTKNMTI